MTKLPVKLFDPISEAADQACERMLQEEPARDYLGMSQIGNPCRRAVWLGMRLRCERPGKLWRVFQMGHLMEDLVKKMLRAAGYGITREQEEFTDFDGRFRGHCDGVISGVTQRDHVLEVKSASASNFEKIRKQGVCKSKPVYEAQIQLYMGYAGLERGLFAVMCRNSLDLYTERVHFDEEKFERFRNAAWDLLTSQTPPDRQPGECYWCDFKGGACENAGAALCWECAHRLSLASAPVGMLLKKHGLDGCLLDKGHFCGAGENAGTDGCAAYDKA